MLFETINLFKKNMKIFIGNKLADASSCRVLEASAPSVFDSGHIMEF
jgi:hypothetical protein